MPMWRCPHCATPQAETARCWVCHRSSTACGSCRHFRRSVAAQLGYCGLDRQRQPLRGDEIRACWESLGPSRSVPPPPLAPRRPGHSSRARSNGRSPARVRRGRAEISRAGARQSPPNALESGGEPGRSPDAGRSRPPEPAGALPAGRNLVRRRGLIRAPARRSFRSRRQDQEPCRTRRRGSPAGSGAGRLAGPRR